MTSATGNEPTTFVASGVVAEPVAGAADTAVVLEHEGRKYTRTDLLKKIGNADSFIETLKTERAKDRELLEAAAKALEKATSAKEVLQAVTTTAAPAAAAPVAQSLDANAIAKQVADQIRGETAADAAKVVQDANFKVAQEALTKHYGKDADAKVRAIAAENDLSFDEAIAMAKSKPKAFNALFLPKTKPAAPTFHGSHGPTPPGPASQPGKGYWAADKTRDRVAAFTAALAAKAA